MLTVDHVRARRRGGELRLTQLKPHDHAKMLDYSSQCITKLKRSTHQKRSEIDDKLSDIVVPAYLQRVADGVQKLLMDRCQFITPEEVNPIELRRLVFQVASEMREVLKDEERFNREATLTAAAAHLEIDIYRIDDYLFGDLKGEQRLQNFDALDPRVLMNSYELAQEQAILLRASELNLKVFCDSANTYRYFFRQLKFRRLLFQIIPAEREEDGYHIQISGPHNLFKSVTKYGLQLSLLLPALRRCHRWNLHAVVHWGKDKIPLDFYSDGHCHEESDASMVDVPEEVQSLLVQLKKHKTQWRARRSSKIINLPKLGVCVPDLIFSHPEHKEKVYLEVMGYWSRDAVWRRVEMVQAGMSEKIIFAVSSRLRVSERVLDEDLPSALYIYKGAIVVRSLTTLLDELITRDPKK